jgi:glycosyltransferase involved in cell wall biosynthesis
VPNTKLSTADAKRQLGISKDEKTLLFFGNIAPYKGLEYLIAAFTKVLKEDRRYRLIVAGRVKACDGYWRTIEQSIASSGITDRVIQKIEYVPDEETELYFKAADVLVLPYTRVFQSGVLFLGYAFGLPAVATNVGALADDIIAGQTGFVCETNDSENLAQAIRTYFASELYENLDARRPRIREFANERYSWTKVGEILKDVYRSMLRN